MTGWPQAGGVAIVQALYKLNEATPTFLHARLVPDVGAAAGESAMQLRRLTAPAAV